MRHAYMIMAHNQPELLKKLLSAIDHEDNDIIIHIDVKSPLVSEEFRNCITKGNIYFTDRMSVSWGGVSQIKVELLLLETALKIGKHDFYHLLTGVDFLLKPIAEINSFFETNKEKEFIHMCSQEFSKGKYEERILYKQYFRDKCGRDRNIYAILNKVGVILQKILKVKNELDIEKFCCGSAYFDISEGLAKYVIAHKQDILKEYKYSFCCDEVFLQTLVWNSEWKEHMYLAEWDNGMAGNMRWIDFTKGQNGSPQTITENDIDEVFASGMLFARKFDYLEHPGAVDKVERLLKKISY